MVSSFAAIFCFEVIDDSVHTLHTVLCLSYTYRTYPQQGQDARLPLHPRVALMQAARALFTHTFVQKTMGMLLMVTLVLPLWVPKLVLVLVLLLVLLLLAFLAAAFGGFSPVLAGVWLR